MDRSNYEKTQSNLFKVILDEGPLTLYTANSKTQNPLGTIHRHFKAMLESKWVKVYSSLEDTSRGKIHYGPTLLGIIHFYNTDPNIQNRLEHYFYRWMGYEDFKKELHEEGFVDKDLANLKKCSALFKKYIHYFAGVEEHIAMLKEPEKIPRDILLYIGEFLLVRRPEYMVIWEELYQKMPTIRKNVDEYMNSTISFYNKMKRKYEGTS